MAQTKTAVTTECSQCWAALRVTETRVTAKVPWNGCRGKASIPAHTVTGDVWWGDEDGGMWMWDCPACGYADSHVFYDAE